MQFFEGRIYKPQGKDLTGVVSSRVPVVTGSLSVQDGKLYYCKSCSYNTSSNNYDLTWNMLSSSGGASTIYNTVTASECMTVSAGELEKKATTEGIESVWTQDIEIKENTIVPQYPKSGSILYDITGSSVPTKDSICAALVSHLNIDGLEDDCQYHPVIELGSFINSNIAYYTIGTNHYELEYLPMTAFHVIKPIVSKSNAKEEYLPYRGDSQICDFFTVSSDNLIASIDVLTFGGEASALLGMHLVFTYKSYVYMCVFSNIISNKNSYDITVSDVTTFGDESIQIDNISAVANATDNPYTDYEIDSNTTVSKCNINTIKLKLSISLLSGSKDISYYSAEKYSCYAKLDPSFIVK